MHGFWLVSISSGRCSFGGEFLRRRVGVVAAVWMLAHSAAAQPTDYFAPNGTNFALPPLPRPVQKMGIHYEADFESQVVGTYFEDFAGDYELTQSLDYNGQPVQLLNTAAYYGVPQPPTSRIL